MPLAPNLAVPLAAGPIVAWLLFRLAAALIPLPYPVADAAAAR